MVTRSSVGKVPTEKIALLLAMSSKVVINTVVPSAFRPVYVQPVIAAEAMSILVWANEIVLPLTAVIDPAPPTPAVLAAILKAAFEQLVVVILSPTTKPGFELNVSVATLVVSEPVVIVGTIERTNLIFFVSSPANLATGSLNLSTRFAATAAWVSPLKGAKPTSAGAELSVPIVTAVPNGELKLSTASTA